MSISAAIYGLKGPKLQAGEAAFFRDCNPFGFILFARNVETPAQIRRLVSDLQNAVGRDNVPILIDQEGGRVQRLRPPHWRNAPCAADFGFLYRQDRAAALRACWLNFRLIADELKHSGINVDCAPVLDLPVNGADPIISDRAFSRNSDEMIALGHAAMAGLSAGGVVPIIKHIPGHGRAEVDSHKALPVIKASLAELEASDFVPFKALSQSPMAMTAHLVLKAVDPDLPVTLSGAVIGRIIRGRLGYDGLLMSDDLDMKALSGSLTWRAEKALLAGCDVVLQCSGRMQDMVKVARGVLPLQGESLRRAEIAMQMAKQGTAFDAVAAQAELDEFMQILEPDA